MTTAQAETNGQKSSRISLHKNRVLEVQSQKFPKIRMPLSAWVVWGYTNKTYTKSFLKPFPPDLKGQTAFGFSPLSVSSYNKRLELCVAQRDLSLNLVLINVPQLQGALIASIAFI